MEPTTVQKIASLVYALRVSDIPESALDQAAWCVLDLVGAASAGLTQKSAQSARGFGKGFFPAGSAGVWFTEHEMSPIGAAFCNAMAGSALDIDDGHRAAGGHPGASLIPIAIAVGQSLNASGRNILAAIVIGYEVAVRAAAARNPATMDTFSTGRWCGFGAAAIRCWLEGKGADILSQALAISGIHAPIQSASAYSKMGHHTKEGIPWGTLTGLAAVDLAAQGFAGPLDIWDDPRYYRKEEVSEGFGDNWMILRTYFKPYACCRWLHAALDAWQALVKEGVTLDDVEQIEVHTFNRAINLNNSPNPTSLEQAQFSLPFCLAVAAVEGPQALLPMSADILDRPQLASFARRVSLQNDPEIDSAFPAHAGARLVVRSKKGVFQKAVEHPRGDPANPLSPEELKSKFYTLAAVSMGRDRADAIVNAVLSLKVSGLARLSAALKGTER